MMGSLLERRLARLELVQPPRSRAKGRVEIIGDDGTTDVETECQRLEAEGVSMVIVLTAGQRREP